MTPSNHNLHSDKEKEALKRKFIGYYEYLRFKSPTC